MTLETSAAEPYIPGRARSETARKVLLYGVYLVIAAIFLTPFVWTVVTSFKTLNDSLNFNLIPHPWTTAAWTARTRNGRPPCSRTFVTASTITPRRRRRERSRRPGAVSRPATTRSSQEARRALRSYMVESACSIRSAIDPGERGSTRTRPTLTDRA